MTTEQPLPLPVKNALDRAFLFARQEPTTPEDQEDVVLAAHTLALVIRRATELRPGTIGAEEFLGEFGPGDFDTYSFHRGVRFALEKVQEKLGGWEQGK